MLNKIDVELNENLLNPFLGRSVNRENLFTLRLWFTFLYDGRPVGSGWFAVCGVAWLRVHFKGGGGRIVNGTTNEQSLRGSGVFVAKLKREISEWMVVVW